VDEDRRAAVLRAVYESGIGGVSGQALAERFGCSRTAIHRDVAALRRGGVDIVGAGGGYHLAADADPVVPAVVEAALRGVLRGPVRWVAETGSTNDDAVAAARAGAPEGIVLGADLQHAGRGRRGRTWVSPQGSGLLFSVLLRPRVAPADAVAVPVLAAVAAARVLHPAARVLWPNDVVIDGAKVAGILCETSTDESGVAWVVVGVGVNVRERPDVPDPRWPVTCLADHGRPLRRTELLARLLVALDAGYRSWLAGRAPLPERFAPVDALAGRSVAIDCPDRRVTGVASGVDRLGGLRIATRAGEVVLHAGEVVRVARG
jgi:BirA family biotin operon repressor/biotin-[acetyl-CoA-carboxylase] ligase